MRQETVWKWGVAICLATAAWTAAAQQQPGGGAPAPGGAASPGGTPAGSPPASPPAAAPAAPPPWQQGRPEELKSSSLHPFLPNLTGRPASELSVDKLKVPRGFKVELWTDGVPEARFMALGDKGTVFVGNRLGSNVYAITEQGGKRVVRTVLKGLNSPNGLVFSKGTLFVAQRERIVRYDGIESSLDQPPEPKVIVDGLPQQANHFWKVLSMGPDGKLYFNIGAPLNIVVPNYLQASIVRVDPASGKLEDFAIGVRNSVGMDFHPVTRQLWFTENSRDWMGDDSPADELNVAVRKGQHFGYPYCHQGDTLDPEFGKNRTCSEFTPPAAKLGTHVAPLGAHFYTGTMFPPEYRNNLFIAQHGSWNRTTKQGYNVVRAVIGPNNSVKIEPFLDGFLVDPKADPPMWGRPVDVLVLRDGSLLVSDDYNGAIYRVSYSK